MAFIARRTRLLLLSCLLLTCGSSRIEAQPPPDAESPRTGQTNDAGPTIHGNTIHPPQLSLELGAAMGKIQDLAFSPDGKHLAIAADALVRIVDVGSGGLITTIRGDRSRGSYGAVTTLAYSPDGRHLIVGIVDASDRGSIRLYETNRYNDLVRLIPGLKTPCRHLQFSADSSRMLAADMDGEMTIYDWPATSQGNDRILGRIRSAGNQSRILDEAQFMDTAPLLVTIEADKTHVYSATSFSEIQDPAVVPAAPLKWLVDITTPGALSMPLNSTIVPRIVDFQFGKEAWVGAGRTDDKRSPTFWAAAYKLSPNSDATPVSVYLSHRYNVTSIALCSDGSTVASGDKFGEVHLWRFRDGKSLHRIAAPGRPIYNARIDSSLTKIGFTRKPDLSNWSINHYGIIDQQLDLRTRAIEAADASIFEKTKATTKRYEETLRYSEPAESQQSKLARVRGSKLVSEFSLRSGKHLSACTFLPPGIDRMGTDSPVVFSDSDGQLICWDATGAHARRYFRGHNNMVTSISVAPGNRCFVTGSIDKTIRVFSTLNYKPAGIFDFDYENNSVTKVPAGTDGAAAGIRVGDRILSIGGATLNDFYERLLLGERPFLPGQRVQVQLSRDGSPISISVRLIEGFDYVEPILSLFVKDEDTWVMWTPEGFYDCSPGADSLIGWHVNHGPHKSAEFFGADQFRESMYRPDVVRQVLNDGVFDSVAKTERRKHLGNAIPPKLSDARQMQRLRPPRVEWISRPPVGTAQTDVEVSLRVFPGGTPTRQVTFLLNGDPVSVKRVDSTRGKATFVVTQKVKLGPGRNTLSVVAASGDSRSDPRQSQIVVQAPMAAAKRNVHAVVVGVNEYDHPMINDLAWACADAQEFDKELGQQSSLGLYRNVKTQLLLDEEATRSSVIDALSDLGNVVEEGDAVMLFFAMHGFVDDRGRYYLAGHDVDPDSLRSSAIPWDTVLETLHEELPGCRRYVFIDACHSGGAAPDFRNPLNELADPRYGTTFFSSCDIAQESQENDDYGHGAFTKVLLDAFKDRRADIEPTEPDGLLNALELTSYVRSRVLAITERQQKPVTYFHQQHSDVAVFASDANHN